MSTENPVQPLCNLRESDGFVLGIFESEVPGINYVPYAIRITNGRLIDSFGDNIEAETGQPILGWMPLPFTAENVEAAYAEHKRLAREFRGVMEGDLDAHFQAVCDIVYELTEAIGARRTMLKLHARLGDNLDGLLLPVSAPTELIQFRNTVTDWVQNKISDEAAIKRLTEILDELED